MPQLYTLDGTRPKSLRNSCTRRDVYFTSWLATKGTPPPLQHQQCPRAAAVSTEAIGKRGRRGKSKLSAWAGGSRTDSAHWWAFQLPRGREPPLKRWARARHGDTDLQSQLLVWLRLGSQVQGLPGLQSKSLPQKIKVEGWLSSTRPQCPSAWRGAQAGQTLSRRSSSY